MTTVSFITCGSAFVLSVQGHAGNDDPRVCAAASMLTCTAVEVMRRLKTEGALLDGIVSIDEEAGETTICGIVRAGSWEKIETSYESILTGYELLEDQYPENITVT